jgi:ribose transport system substrate-binding protein
MKRPFHAPSLRRGVTAALVVPVVALAVGCGSASSSSSAGSGSASSAPPSTSTAAANASVNAAKAFLAPYLKPPTKIEISEPLKTKPPTGKSVIFLQLNVPGTQVIGQAMQEATKALGWKYGVIPFDQAQPQSLQAAFNTALLEHPDMVFVVAQPAATWGSQTIAHYKAAGVRIVYGAIPPVPGGWVIGDPNAPSNNVLWGKILAAEFAVDSNGHGNVVVEHLPVFPGLTAVVQGFQSGVKTFCPGCSVNVVNVTLDQISTKSVPSFMVSQLKRTPDANYLMFDYGPFSDGIQSALEAAGLQKVKVFGEGGDVTNFAGLKSGTQLAWTTFSQAYQAWEGLDIYLRLLEGMPNAPGEQAEPVQLLTQQNINSVQLPQGNWLYPVGYQQQFENLWHVGG